MPKVSGSGSVVNVFVGQAGNQLGTSFLNFVAAGDHEGSVDASIPILFEEQANLSLTARAVMIDMEPKVIIQQRREAEKKGSYAYAKHSVINAQSGSANNWALGYLRHGPMHRESLEEGFRKRAEAADLLEGFMTWQSLAGGTGSGMGAYVAELLRECYPKSALLSVVVWPHMSGEVTIQSYNALFSLDCLYPVCDGIISLENDAAKRVCRQRLGLEKPSHADLNSVFALQLSGALLPTDGLSSMLLPPLRILCPLPTHKLISTRAIPQCASRMREYNSNSWSQISKHLYQMHIDNGCIDEGLNWRLQASSSNFRNRSIGAVLVGRGIDAQTFDVAPWQSSLLYSLRPSFLFNHSPNWREKSAFLLATNTGVVEPLETCLQVGSRLLEKNAYLFHYEKYGLSKDDIIAMFAGMESTCRAYQNL